MTDVPTAGEPHPAPVPTHAPDRSDQTGDGASRRCPVCGTDNPADSSFCEACGADLVVTARASEGSATGTAYASPDGATDPASDRASDGASDGPVLVSATPQTAPAGEESPLDVGWTGAVPTPSAPSPDDELTCHACGQGRIVDGYCDNCGSPPPDPRDHFVESPTSWVGGVCDIGRRHSRNEDAMSLSATEAPGSRAVLVVCDGVSMASDSHIASLAAATEARAVLDQPFPRGVGTPDAWTAAAGRALKTAVIRANEAVIAAVVEDVPNPPSCTFASAVVEDDVIVAGNVGDSRVYWLPDAADEPALQLGRDDSFAQEQIAAGVPRLDAEHGPHAHSITRWLGRDAPDDLTPHLTTVTATAGWLLVCSDGLWNYCSEAEDLRTLLHGVVASAEDPNPTALAQALVDFANEQGGRDNITVALARLAGRGSSTTSEPAATTTPVEGDRADG